MKLESKNISVRHLEEKDMLYIQKLWGDGNTMLESGGAFAIKDEDLNQMFSILRKEDASINNHFVIETDGKHIGDINIRNYSEDSKKGQIDLKIEYTERKKGYAKEALKLYLDYFFNKLGAEEIYMEFWLENYFVKEKLVEYGFEFASVSDDLYRLNINKESYLKSSLNGGNNEL